MSLGQRSYWCENTITHAQIPPYSVHHMTLKNVCLSHYFANWLNAKNLCDSGEQRKKRSAQVPELDTSVSIIPGDFLKNGDERLVVLNRVAKSVIESLRDKHETHEFTYRGRPVSHMLNSGWKRARTNAGLNQVRVHDLKHTFGRRLRDAGVGFEDRQDLLGHRAGRITTHYSTAELSKLLDAANKVCNRKGKPPELVVLRRLNVN